MKKIPYSILCIAFHIVVFHAEALIGDVLGTLRLDEFGQEAYQFGYVFVLNNPGVDKGLDKACKLRNGHIQLHFKFFFYRCVLGR